MKSIGYLIVSLPEAYSNKAKLSTGQDFIINSTIENVEYINRVCKVEYSPEGTILSPGDEVIVHHNIFRLRNGIKGEQVDSNFYLWGNLYYVPLTEVFMYKGEFGWVPIEPYCFVKPIEQEDLVTTSNFSITSTENSYKGMKRRVGVLSHPNRNLINQSLQKGDKVLFTPDSEYEFIIDGELYYKMSDKDIIAKV